MALRDFEPGIEEGEKMITPHRTKNKGSVIGCKGKNPRKPLKNGYLKRSKSAVLRVGMRVAQLKSLSENQGRKLRVYVAIRAFALSRWAALYGKPNGDESGVSAPCACCGSYFPTDYKKYPVSALQCDHINGRHGHAPWDLDRLIDPSNFQFLCFLCHCAKTYKIDHADHDWKIWKTEMLDLRLRIYEQRPLLAGSMKWPIETQMEAVLKVLGKPKRIIDYYLQGKHEDWARREKERGDS